MAYLSKYMYIVHYSIGVSAKFNFQQMKTFNKKKNNKTPFL